MFYQSKNPNANLHQSYMILHSTHDFTFLSYLTPHGLIYNQDIQVRFEYHISYLGSKKYDKNG